MSKVIANLTALMIIDISLRNAVVAVAKELEREHGRKNSAARLYVYVSKADEAARVRNYKNGERKDVQSVALAYIHDDGELDYKNADLLEVITTVLGNKHDLVLPNIAYSKGYITTQGTTPPTAAPTITRIVGRASSANKAPTIAQKQAPQPQDEAKQKRAPKRTAKNAEIDAQDLAGE